MQRLAVRVVRGKAVHPDRMHSNLDLTCGALLSQRVLLTLISSGLASDDAYRVVQDIAQRASDAAGVLRDGRSWRRSSIGALHAVCGGDRRVGGEVTAESAASYALPVVEVSSSCATGT
jgi:hypothetical protein